jgi:hypothetical protein
VGSPQDEYGADASYVDFDLGAIAINTAGNHKFKFTVTGRNPLSFDYMICFDALKFNVR